MIRATCLTVLFAWSVWLPTAWSAPENPVILRVEEDWELVLGEPDPLQDSPQISTWMSPTSSLEGEHFGIDLNHAQRPDFSAGGFQTKARVGEVLVDDEISDNGDNLLYNHEQVRWTQVMAVHAGQLLFMVKDGTSQSWGNFGGPSSTVRFASSPVSNLDGYSPTDSANWSGVGYAANRVSSLTLVRVRYFLSNGEVVSVDLQISVL